MRKAKTEQTEEAPFKPSDMNPRQVEKSHRDGEPLMKGDKKFNDALYAGNTELATLDRNFSIIELPRSLSGNTFYLVFSPSLLEDDYNYLKENHRTLFPVVINSKNQAFIQHLSSLENYPFTSMLVLPNNTFVLAYYNRPHFSGMTHVVVAINNINKSGCYYPVFDDKSGNCIGVDKLGETGAKTSEERVREEIKDIEEIIDEQRRMYVSSLSEKDQKKSREFRGEAPDSLLKEEFKSEI